jgi:hypothetical protein
MRLTILLIPLFILGCTTMSDISADREAVKSIKTVAIAPFTSAVKVRTVKSIFTKDRTSPPVTREILSEAEENFKSVFVKLNYKIIEKQKLDILQKDKESAMIGITVENTKRIGELIGADAILFGEITEYDEIEGNANIPQNGLIPRRGHESDDTINTYKFRIIIRLVSTSDGTILLTEKNNYSEARQIKDDPGTDSLASYRRYILIKMQNDLIEYMTNKK